MKTHSSVIKRIYVFILFMVLFSVLSFAAYHCANLPDLTEILKRHPVNPINNPQGVSRQSTILDTERITSDWISLPEENAFTIGIEEDYYFFNSGESNPFTIQVEGETPVYISKVYFKVAGSLDYLQYNLNSEVNSFDLEYQLSNQVGCGWFTLLVIAEGQSEAERSNELAIYVNVYDPLNEECPTSVPQGTIDPPDGTLTEDLSQIFTITYDTSMKTNTLTYGNDMGVEAATGSWSTDSVTNDTLSISPADQWSENKDRQLYAQVYESKGYYMARVSATYFIDYNAPVGTPDPDPSEYITDLDGCVVITFDDVMDSDNYTLGGTMNSDIGSAVWSTVVIDSIEKENNTLTLCPSSEWTEGDGRTLTLDAIDQAGHPMQETLSLTYNIDGTAPSPISIDPPDETDIYVNSSIEIVLDEGIVPDTLELSEYMSPAANTPVVSQTNIPNDTITITPELFWPSGPNRNLIITAEDIAGNVMEISLTYEVNFNLTDVDTTGDVGIYNSIAVIGDGGTETDIYISYYDTDNGNLLFARSSDNGSSWIYRTVEVGVGDEVGEYNSIAVLGDGGATTSVYISYYDRGGDLKFAKSTDNGNTWNAGDIEIVDSGSVGRYTSIQAVGDGGSSSKIYITYYDNGNKYLKFVRSDDNGDNWNTPINVVTDGNSGKFTSLYVVGTGDSSTKLYAAYGTDISSRLNFVKSNDNGATWGTPVTIDNTIGTGNDISIAVSASNRIFISYRDSSEVYADLKLAYSDDEGSTWEFDTIEASGDAGWNTSITTLGTGSETRVLISYYDATVGREDLKLALSLDNGQTWNRYLLDTDNKAGYMCTSIAAIEGSQGTPLHYISYYTSPGRDLKLAH